LQDVFLSKTHSISQGSNVVDAATWNIYGFLWGDKCVSSTQLNRPTWSKQSPCPPSNK
jgi:hypothetical protein